MIEMMTEKLHCGKSRSELQLLREREKHWRLKYISLNRQFKEIKTVVNVHKQDIKTNENARPHLVTRTVGLQALLCPKKVSALCDQNIGYLQKILKYIELFVGR